MDLIPLIHTSMQYLYPVTHLTETSSRKRDEYLNNYYLERFKSLVFGALSVGLAVLAFSKRKSLRFRVIMIGASALTALFWSKRPNDPVNLFKAANNAIKRREEAVKLIKKGASLEHTINIEGGRKYGLAEMATVRGNIYVLNYLVKIGYDFLKMDRKICLMELAPSMEVVELLTRHNVPLYTQDFNPLLLQVHDLIAKIKQSIKMTTRRAQQSYIEEIKNKSLVIQHFIVHDVHKQLNSDDRNVVNELLTRELPTAIARSNPELKGLIEEELEKLSGLSF